MLCYGLPSTGIKHVSVLGKQVKNSRSLLGFSGQNSMNSYDVKSCKDLQTFKTVYNS